MFSALAGLAALEVAPSFSRVLKDCTVVEGQDFVLRCSVQGTPVPQITWLLNGEFPLLQPPGPFGPACPLTWLGMNLQGTGSSRDHGVCYWLAGDTGQVAIPI